ncbi:MFS transporter [Corynebacterium atypicum]|uniref:MFS transporter n=1 Tax=Corynebacterium atypicum TaxID=191610 RepID=UPI000570AA77|nr:MFS transporter [Corynebacterium atypicum]
MSAPTKARAATAKAAVPILLFTFLFSLITDNGFKFMNLPISQDLGLSVTEVSLQATLAGIVIGIGAVVYAALADAVNIRKLLVIGIALIAVGSIIGFLGQSVWMLVLVGRVIQTTGLAAAETLYVIYVTKHLPEKDQKTYLGFSTACFQLSFLFGTLAGGAIATYIAWPFMFLLALVSVLAIPVVLKTVPPEEHSISHLDVAGLAYVAVFATSLIMWAQAINSLKNWLWLIPAAIGIGLFAWHIKAHSGALVRPEFFNPRYASSLLTVLIIYSTQLGLTVIVLPFALNSLHGMELDQVSYLLVPGYLVGTLVGVFSGAIGKALNSRQTMAVALGCIVGALVLSALFINTNVWVLGFAVVLFSAGFAGMYAPLMNTAMSHMPTEKRGVAVGFYNLTINIAVPLGIAYAAALVDFLPQEEGSAGLYSMVLWVLVGVAVAGTAFFFISDTAMARSERAAGEVPVTAL